MKHENEHIDQLEQIFRNRLQNGEYKLVPGAADRAMANWKANFPSGTVSTPGLGAKLGKIWASVFTKFVALPLLIVCSASVLYFATRNDSSEQPSQNKPVVTKPQTPEIQELIQTSTSNDDMSPVVNSNKELLQESGKSGKTGKLDKQMASPNDKLSIDTVGKTAPTDSKTLIADTVQQKKTALPTKQEKTKRKSSQDKIRDMMQKQVNDKDTGVILFEEKK